ncbi:hypothetical protein C4900_02105 [Acidiferrobacter thiooxydans]|uniref:Uncharacterized protein n=1 Tax=Acidiferrobacter thiooxydans TaxID=163359 RepID=A0A368HLY9_9GAMM|nr:hypothetical protein C4900_02105 [Acidiferrobacter thiooxydans]
MAQGPLTLHLEGRPEAWAFAQFLKRATWGYHRGRTISADEAYAMQCFAERLRLALAAQGYVPR